MASVKQTVGTQAKATGRKGETQGNFYRRGGIAFGQPITSMNGRAVTNARGKK